MRENSACRRRRRDAWWRVATARATAAQLRQRVLQRPVRHPSPAAASPARRVRLQLHATLHSRRVRWSRRRQPGARPALAAAAAVRSRRVRRAGGAPLLRGGTAPPYDEHRQLQPNPPTLPSRSRFEGGAGWLLCVYARCTSVTPHTELQVRGGPPVTRWQPPCTPRRQGSSEMPISTAASA